jgi:hypothetical protein
LHTNTSHFLQWTFPIFLLYFETNATSSGSFCVWCISHIRLSR